MLDESRMDKKSVNRSSQPQSRATAIDCKKNTELTHKPWLRNNKKREGSGGSTSKNEPFRKNGPSQRGRDQFDRKPRPRGTNRFVVGRTQNTGIGEDDEPEIGSVFVPGSKKQNLNHLLNFVYPTRGGQEHRGQGPMARRQQQHRISYRHEHDLYLRAYCQFVVKEDGDYNVNVMDPDVPIKWAQIEEIVVRSTGRSECPICLGLPVAGRVGHCGHVYCWPCVLHYAAAHDKQPPPCPVCSMPLEVKDMKPTKMVQWEPPAEEITMRLVRRLRGSTTVDIAPPQGEIEEITSHILPLEKVTNAPYCKLFTATKHQVQDILKRERKEIETQILAEIDTTEIVFLEQALQILKDKEEHVEIKCNPKIETVEEIEAPIVYQKQEVMEKKLDWFDVTNDEAACINNIEQKTETLSITESSLNPDAPCFDSNNEDLQDSPPDSEQIDDNSTITDIDKENQSKYFYFYQADDGQQVFLNSINVRILNASWGALAAAPSVIRGRVLHRETLPLSEQTRKHMPYTAHLPLHCSFDIVELDLLPPYVTPAALHNFAEDLERRARARARQERDEKRRERAYRRAMEGPPKPDFFSQEVFPPAPTYSSPPIDSPPLPSEPPSSSTSIGSPPPSGPSFAKMASTSGIWRVRKSSTNSTSLPSPPVDNEECSGPRALVLSDAIEAALHAAPSPSNKKNKKNKQKILFSTGMQRAA